MATLSVTAIDGNTVRWSVTGLSTAHSRQRKFCSTALSNDGTSIVTGEDVYANAGASSKSGYIYNMVPGLTYTIYVEIFDTSDYDGVLLATLTKSITMPSSVTGTLSLSLSATSDTITATLRWTASAYGTYTISVMRSGTSYDNILSTTVTGTSGTVHLTFDTYIEAETYYEAWAGLYDADGNSLAADENNVTTDAKPVATGTLSLTMSPASTSMTLIMKWTASISGTYTIRVLWAGSDLYEYPVSGTSGTKTVTITGLSANTSYSCIVGLYNADDEILYDAYGNEASDQDTITTSNESFAWTYAGLDSNGTPVAGTRKVAGYGIYVQAAEWNQLIEVIETNFSVSLDAAKVYSGQSITAYVYNLAANVVGVSTVTKDVTEIAASHFNALMDAANA